MGTKTSTKPTETPVAASRLIRLEPKTDPGCETHPQTWVITISRHTDHRTGNHVLNNIEVHLLALPEASRTATEYRRTHEGSGGHLYELLIAEQTIETHAFTSATEATMPPPAKFKYELVINPKPGENLTSLVEAAINQRYILSNKEVEDRSSMQV